MKLAVRDVSAFEVVENRVQQTMVPIIMRMLAQLLDQLLRNGERTIAGDVRAHLQILFLSMP